MRSGAEVHLRACGVPVSTRTYGIYRSSLMELETRTRTNTNPNGTEANAAGRSGNACALRKQFKCGMIQEGEGQYYASCPLHTILFTILTCAQRTRVHFCPQHWLLCHLGLY